MTVPMQLKKPKEESAWYPLFMHLKDKPFGYRMSFNQLAVALGTDPLNRQAIYPQCHRAAKELERTCNRTFVSDRNAGYRIPEPKEHLSLVDDRRRYAGRHIRRGEVIGDSAHRPSLTSEESKTLTDVLVQMSRVRQALRHVNKRVDQVEAVQAEQSTLTAAQLADIQARLSRLEQFKGQGH